MRARLYAILSLMMVSFSALSQQETTFVQDVNSSINEGMWWTDYIVKYVFYSISVGGKEIPLVLIWLILGAVFFTIRMSFINIIGFKHAINIVKGKYDHLLHGTKEVQSADIDSSEAIDANIQESQNVNEAGQVSHFQALATALSGTVGLGNIAGVAVAVAAGGPGATFWMIIAGILGMSTKFVECTLGVKYREEKEDGRVSGGPMYYLDKGLAKRNWPIMGKILGAFFAICCVGGSLGGGNMFQVNQARAQFLNLPMFEGTFMATESGWVLFGLVMAIAVGVVIIGGIQSIAKVTDKIVPFMCGLYVLAAVVVLGANVSEIPGAFGEIIAGAFSAKAAFGGFLGVLIQGFRRAAFSNEAGIGSASIAHSAVKTKEPVSEGLVALLEPFIDTVVVCTMTALVLVITGVYTDESVSGVGMTSIAFESVFGSVANLILTIAVVLFAFSTMISWSYYGLKSWTYLFGESKTTENIYKVLFLVFVVIGAVLTLGKVIDFSDSMIFAMCFPNIIGLYIMSSEVRQDMDAFLAKVKSLV